MRSFTLEQRLNPSLAIRALSPIAATLVTILAGCAMFYVLGYEPLGTLKVFFIDPLTSVYGISEVLLKACPLVLIGLGLAIGFRANVWNIGAEGQLTIGAVCAGGIALAIGDREFGFTLFIMVILGALGGMAWASIPAFLKVRFNTNEILVGILSSQMEGVFPFSTAQLQYDGAVIPKTLLVPVAFELKSIFF